MIAIRVGSKALMQTSNGVTYGYHFMKRLKSGQWVEKHGTRGDSIKYDIGVTPENIIWQVPNEDYYYDSQILYYAISYEAIK